MVDHSRSNRIIQAAHDRGEFERPALNNLRKRLRADEDLRVFDSLSDRSLETLRQAVLGED